MLNFAKDAGKVVTDDSADTITGAGGVKV